ncbi:MULTISPECIES: hypothetical protein [unclassified Streptomyces]|uniref:hypothetical protein n=1 Tax=unclassified Streptomyces TaxID=2593676 RepID=UPI0011C8FC47|nr:MULTISPECIES: hypothetical protein [unclassified Streptomyces]TXL88437.1 hypothetical protein EW053_18820 [Streptomyces sp. IB2014 016-6]
MNQRSLLGLAAFVQLHRIHYLSYARARLLDESASEAAVDATISAVAGRWSELLRNARPAADAWQQLRAQIQAASRDTAAGQDPAVGRLYHALSQNTADTALLRWRLSMTPEAIADLMGIDIPTVTASLLTARRQFSDTALRQLEHHASQP